MDYLERLEHELYQTGLNIDYHCPPNCRGLYRRYTDGFEYIAVAPHLTRPEKTCVAYHEAGHRHTILCDCSKSKNEYRANKWAARKLVPIDRLLSALKAGATNIYEAADFLQITEEFLQTTLLIYCNRYGLWKIIDDWVISFQPNLMAYNYKTRRMLPE